MVDTLDGARAHHKRNNTACSHANLIVVKHGLIEKFNQTLSDMEEEISDLEDDIEDDDADGGRLPASSDLDEVERAIDAMLAIQEKIAPLVARITNAAKFRQKNSDEVARLDSIPLCGGRGPMLKSEGGCGICRDCLHHDFVRSSYYAT